MGQTRKTPWAILLFVCVHFIGEIHSLIQDELRPYEKRFVNGGITSREEDLHMCSNHFEIHDSKIIRTQDSRALGAKYINEKDVGTRDECLRLCCKTEGCNVFVFDESSSGSCYMFDCGMPDDFKCKFTTHQKYTSAISRQLTELEHQIKFTQHEHELTRLRDPPKLNLTNGGTTSTAAPQNKEALAYAFGSSESHSKKGCSHYQFECHKSGECIAIYNVCDGIPQCSDNSDEAPEGCLTKTSTSTPVQQPPSVPSSHTEIKGPEAYPNGDSRVEFSPNNHWPTNPHYDEGSQQLTNYQSSPQNPAVQQNSNVIKSRANYGREGENLANYREENQWTNQQFHPASQIFTHKGNGLVPQTAERFAQQRPYPAEIPQRQLNEQLPNEYSKYYYENGVYRPYGMQNTQNVNWQPAGHRDMASAQVEVESPINRPDYPPNSVPSDYYYEEYRTRNQPFNPQGNYPQSQIPQHNPQMVNRIAYQHQKDISNVDEPVKHEAPVVVVAVAAHTSTTLPPHTTSTTVKPEEKTKPNESVTEHVVHSRRKVDKLTAESETFLSDEIEGHSNSPSGAILSLVMGLSVTSIMIVLVGCRMRMVRKRIRRGGKSGYAHDPDFLVNGMYL